MRWLLSSVSHSRAWSRQMSAFENVELPMTVLGKLSKKERQERALRLLALVGLRDRTEHLPSELSGGEQQRVTIARVSSVPLDNLNGES